MPILTPAKTICRGRLIGEKARCEQPPALTLSREPILQSRSAPSIRDPLSLGPVTSLPGLPFSTVLNGNGVDTLARAVFTPA